MVLVRYRGVDREEIQRNLNERARSGEVHTQFEEATQIFRDNWETHRQRPIAAGLSFRLRVRYAPGKLGWRWCARVDPGTGRVSAVFHWRAVEPCKNDFREAIKDIPFDTYPRGRKSNPIETPGTEIEFQLTPAEWELHKDTVKDLAVAVYRALQQPNEGLQVSDHDDDENDDDE